MASTAQEIQARLAEKEEKLRKLKLVQLYRSKSEFRNLNDSIETWREGCQQALLDLLNKVKELNPEPEDITMEKLLLRMGIEPSLLRYSVEDENFY